MRILLCRFHRHQDEQHRTAG
jgi:hypothetical protein